MYTKKELKQRGAFSLLEVMIVIVIMGIFAGMAIPSFMESMRKAEAQTATDFMGKIRDGEVGYKAAHGKFYAKANDLNRTLDVLNVGAESAGDFEYGIKVGDTTLLIRANKPGKTNYIYMFYPPANSAKVSGYLEEEWTKNIYTVDYVSEPATPTAIDLTDGTVISTY